jgi:uncharacterized FlaG/YvyC family protein
VQQVSQRKSNVSDITKTSDTEISRTSGNDASTKSGIIADNNDAVQNLNAADAAALTAAETKNAKVPEEYADNQKRRAIEYDIDKLIKELFPDLGVKFRVHESGQVITSVLNNATKEVVREFPAENILNIIYSMTQKIGLVTNKKM